MAASMGYLALSSALLFLALTVYEIWLTGFVLIWAIDAYLAVTANGVARTSLWGLAWRTLKRCWPVLVPYALYAVLFFFSHRIELHHPRMRLDRVFVVFLSIHARVYHWLFNVPWLSSVRQAKAFLQMPLAWGLAAAFVIIGAFLWIRIRRTSSPMDQGEPATPLGPSLVLAWGCFLGARLFCILGGGVSLQQRHDYGAVMGAAIAAAALLEWLLRRLSAHRVLALSLRGGIVILLLLMTLASAGINVSCRDRSIREDIVYRTLAPVAATMKERQEPKTIVVLCEGGGLYSWYDGWILELRLNHRPYYLDYPGKAQQRALAEAVPVPCFVVRQAFFVNGKIQVQIDRLQNDSAVLLSGGHQYQQRLIPLQEALVYRWNESQHALLLVRGDVLPAFKSGNEPGMTQGL